MLKAIKKIKHEHMGMGMELVSKLYFYLHAHDIMIKQAHYNFQPVITDRSRLCM